MKRLFTLLVAMITVICMTAAPQRLVTKSKQIKPDLKFERTIDALPNKAVVKKQSKAFGKSVVPVNRMHKAEAGVIECTYDAINYQEYSTDVWFYPVTSDGTYQFYVDILGTMDEIEPGKVYGMDDVDPEYTYVKVVEDASRSFVADLACVFKEASDGTLVFDLECTTEDGKSYTLTYKELEIPTEFTEVKLDEPTKTELRDFTSTDGMFQFICSNADYDYAFTIVSDGVAGEYTTEDVYGLNQYTYLYNGETQIRLCGIEVAMTSLGDNDYHFEGKLYAYNGNAYVVSGNYIEPKAKEFVDIKATNLEIDDSMFDLYQMFVGYGVATLTASNDEYTLNGYLYSYDELAGHYDDEYRHVQVWEIVGPDDQPVEVFSADFDLDNVDGSWVVKGSVLGMNSVQYNLDLSFQIPEPTENLTYTSTNGLVADWTDYGEIEIYAKEENGDFLDINLDAAEFVSGEYQLSEYSKSMIVVGDNSYPVYNGTFKLNLEDETFTFSGLCQAGAAMWTVNVSGEIYVETDPYDAQEGDIDVAYTLEEVDEFEVNVEEGYAYLSASSEERGDLWACVIFIDEDGLKAGTYTIDESYEPGTAQPGECDGFNVYPTIYGTLDEDGYILDMWYCSTGTITVSYDEDNDVQMECNAVNTNGLNVHVTVNMPDTQTGIKNVDNNKSKEVYNINGMRMDAKNLKSGVYVVNGKKHIVK